MDSMNWPNSGQLRACRWATYSCMNADVTATMANARNQDPGPPPSARAAHATAAMAKTTPHTRMSAPEYRRASATAWSLRPSAHNGDCERNPMTSRPRGPAMRATRATAHRMPLRPTSVTEKRTATVATSSICSTAPPTRMPSTKMDCLAAPMGAPGRWGDFS